VTSWIGAEYEERKRRLQSRFDALIDLFEDQKQYEIWRLAVDVQNAANGLLTDLAAIAFADER
jgi:hypothetical protein